MKLVRFIALNEDAKTGRNARLGVLQGDRIAELSVHTLGLPADRAEWFADMVAFIGAGDKALAVVKERLESIFKTSACPVDSVRLLAPFMPSTILCSGSNYHAHNKEKAGSPLSGKEPEFFVKTSDCVIGPGDGIVHDPKHTQKLDCETELAIIIGKPGRHIPLDRALDHVYGYSIINDVTARDLQVRRKPDGSTFYELGRGKMFDTSAPFGPCIVTSDDIRDPQKLRLRTRINGELRQSGNTADMIWSCAELVHFFSNSFTLKPGMVIITGTPAGTAWSVDTELGGKWSPPEEPEEDGAKVVPAKGYNQPGDRIESEIEGIGVLHNIITQ